MYGILDGTFRVQKWHVCNMNGVFEKRSIRILMGTMNGNRGEEGFNSVDEIMMNNCRDITLHYNG